MRSAALLQFAEEVGPASDGRPDGSDGDPVRVAGGRTQWLVGGPPDEGVREVTAPAGIVSLSPEEMTVRVGAGTTVPELERALRGVGQRVALPDWPGATVGGVLSVGRSGVRRLGDGPVRDALLGAEVVTAGGRLVTAGGSTVKNVSGFDLPRLLVGSLGTLALIAEVVLRTRPLPEATRWRCGEADAFAVLESLYRPTAVLWDGTTTWVLIEGEREDVDDQVRLAAALGVDRDADGPPALPPHRVSSRPSSVRGLVDRSEPFVAEVGVGLVHTSAGTVTEAPADALVALHRRIKAAFDPDGRLNPGRRVLVGAP